MYRQNVVARKYRLTNRSLKSESELFGGKKIELRFTSLAQTIHSSVYFELSYEQASSASDGEPRR